MAVVVAPSILARLPYLFSALAAAVVILLSPRTAEATITIDPSYVNSTPGGVVTFHATGGSGDYQWSMAANPSGGYVESGGIYHAGMFPLVDDKVLVTDSLGETATATVGVTYWETLVVRQPTGTIPPRGSRQIQASGGVAPYYYSFVSNASGGNVSASGVYTAGRRGKVIDVVRITDTVGQVVTAVFAVGAGMTITPGSAKVAPRADLDFDATGGDGTPPVWSISQNKSGGTIDPATGGYHAGANTHVADTVRATDALGNFAEVSVSVGGGVAIEPSIAWTSPRGTIALAAFGGTNTFAWSLSASPSGGTIDAATGAYVAGPNGSVKDEVYVIDGAGNWAVTVVDIGPAIALSPSSSAVSPHGTVFLTVSGGSGSYANVAIESNASGATIGSNLVYTAGAKDGRDTIVVTDSVGSSARATVEVKALPETQGAPVGGSSGHPNGANIGGGGGAGCQAASYSEGASRGSVAAMIVLGAVLGSRRRRRR